jgi:AraC-like DNA-binding protein
MIPSSGALLHKQRTIADPDQLQDAVYGTIVRVDRLSPTRTPSRVEQFQSTAGWGLDIGELHCKLRAQGPLAPASVGIVFILRAGGSSLCGIKVEDGAIVMMPAGSTLSANVIPGFSYIGTTVPASSWIAAQSIDSGIVVERAADDVIMRRSPAERFDTTERLLRHSIAKLGTIEGDPSAVMEDHVTLLARAFADGAGETPTNGRATASRRRHALRAQDWIHAHINDAIRIVDLCAVLGTSRRQLEYSFRSTFDVSPHEYIISVRLNEIRRALLKRRNDGLSITDLALLHGVTHLGRFAASYRELFGELPSETGSSHQRVPELSSAKESRRSRRRPENGRSS